MKTKSIAVLLTAAAAFGCASEKSPNTNAMPNSNQAINGAPTVIVPTNSNNGGAVNVPNPTLQEKINAQNMNPTMNGVNVAKPVEIKLKPGEPPPGARQAPDDSYVFGGSRGKDFFEARVFNNHPQLVKIEKVMDGTTTKYKVFLKNGKVVDVDESKVTPMESTSPVNILLAAGIAPPAVPKGETRQNEKKPEN